MKGFFIAFWAEILKVRKSRVFIGTIVFFAFVAVMMGLLMYVSKHPEIAGRSATMGAKASMTGDGSWTAFFSLLIQVILSLGTIGFGLVTSWIFGREYADRVVKDIISLPVSRTQIVMAKMFALTLWCVLLSAVFILSATLIGLIVGLPNWSLEVFFSGLRIYSISAVLTVLLCPVVALVASVGRGYLLPLGFVILTLVITQLLFVGIPDATVYFPWAFPALCSGLVGENALMPVLGSYLIFGFTILLGLMGTIFWWRYADDK